MSFVRKIFEEESNRVRETVFNSLVVEPGTIKQKISEEIFVKEFLPYFEGKPIPESRQNILAIWIGIAGSPISEVTVVDSSGNPLYDVPPIFDSSFISASREGIVTNNYDHITEHAALISNNIPQAGSSFLNSELQKKLEGISEHSNHSRNYERWRAIFNRYNNSTVNEAKDTKQINIDITLDEEY